MYLKMDTELKKLGVPAVVAGFQNMAVWECGYTVCVDVCKAADKFLDKTDPLHFKIKNLSIAIPMTLSRCQKAKPTKAQIRALNSVMITTNQLNTLLMLSRDLEHIPFDEFLELNNKIKIFSAKLGKLIKFRKQKLNKK